MGQNEDPNREESQKQMGVVSNSGYRLKSLMNVDRPKLTPEIALQELQDKMKREEEMAREGGHAFSFQRGNANQNRENYRGQNMTPAQLSQSMDYNSWQTPGLATVNMDDMNSSQADARRAQTSENPGEQAVAESQMTSTMIKQSLSDLRSRLNQMKKDSEITSKMY